MVVADIPCAVVADSERRQFETTPESEAFGTAMRTQMGERSQGDLGRAVADQEGRAEPYGQSVVSNWLLGKEPNPRQAFAIERALGVRPGTLTRLLGYMPLDARPVRSFEDVIQSDPSLSPQHRNALRNLYRDLAQGPRRSPRKSRP